MVILFLVLPFQKLQIFSFTFAAPFISLTLLSRLIDLCSVLSFALFFPISPLTLFSMIYCARFGLNVLFLPLVFLHGICCGSSHSFGFLPLNFFPLAPCGNLSRKVLFLVSLATACRVEELQAVSSSVSFSGGDIFLSYLPEFRAKSESASNPLPRYFRVHSLRDFVGYLPDELLLCPVRALMVYLDRTYSLSPPPSSLFVSLRSPSRPLSKNALSFFLRSVILQSLPSPSSSPSFFLFVWVLFCQRS